MRWQITNLDIDGTIPAQKRLFSRVENHVALREYEQSLRLWPSYSALQAVRQHLNKLGSAELHKQIVFYGTGDLNHLSSLLIEQLPDSAKPLTVVLFDNHPDWFALPPRYHCGNWIANVLKLDWVESVILIGQNSDDLNGRDFWFTPFAELLSGRLKIIPYRKSAVRVPLVVASNHSNEQANLATSICSPAFMSSELRFPTLENLGTERLANYLQDELAGKNVYIAIDKDVLREEDAKCDWEQGELSIQELLTLLSSIVSKADVVGADICGERSPEPLNNIIKRFDAGRLFDNRINEGEFSKASLINEQANLAILEAISATRATALTKEALCTS